MAEGIARTNRVNLACTAGELEDLREIARQWSKESDWTETVASVAWYFVAKELAKMRKRGVIKAPYQAATKDLLKRLEALHGSPASQRKNGTRKTNP